MYKTSKYYSYIFYADRNVRPCTILGYTLTTFPKSRKTLMHNQSNRDLWHNCKRNKRNQRTNKLHLNASRRTLHLILNWISSGVFSYILDPCNPDPCENGGQCSRTPSDNQPYTCSCINGYSGPQCKTGESSVLSGIAWKIVHYILL